MRHRMSGKRLGRTSSHRKAMRRNQAASLFEHGAIRTTEAKAKELRRFVEKLITVARQGTLHARRQVLSELGRDRPMFGPDGNQAEQTVVQKLFDEIAPRYEDRPGGYTRIIRLAERRIGDAGQQVILQLVEETSTSRGEPEAPSRRKRRAVKRHAAAADAVSDRPAGDATASEAADGEEPSPQAAPEPAEADDGAEAEEPAEPQGDEPTKSD